MPDLFTKEQQYNDSITVTDLERLEELDPSKMNLFTYSGPKDTCQGIAIGRLGNMAGGFHFNLFGVKWYGTEHLYLCGKWSNEGEKCVEIQEYIRKMPSGVYAKRCSKAKYESLIRPDFPTFRRKESSLRSSRMIPSGPHTPMRTVSITV